MAFVDTGFGPVVSSLIQQGFLAREMEEGLDSILAYRRLALQETFPGRIGESLTRTRTGRLAPVTTALTPSNINNGLDNQLTPGSFSFEQYLFTMSEYAATQNLNIMQEQATIADMFMKIARNNGVQAAQSLERICRSRLFGAYMSGNTRSIAWAGNTIASNGSANTSGAQTANSAITCNVNLDDIRGFTTVVSNGAPTAPTVGTPLTGVITQSTGAKFTFKTTSAATALTYQSGHTVAEVTNTPDAVPGFITVVLINPIAPTTGNWTPATGDTYVCDNAPIMLRPNNRLNHSLITAGDVVSLGLFEDAVAILRDNGVPPMPDGTYYVILDNTSMRQLFADADFKLLYQGSSFDKAEWGQQEVVKMLGLTFIPTTEAYVQTTPALGAAGPRIRRPIVCGAECIIQGNFEGMETWLSNRGMDDLDGSIVMIDGVVQIVREPLDRLQQQIAMSWTWIGDFAVPTDITATSTIIPTASNALYKRCVVIEHAG